MDNEELEAIFGNAWNLGVIIALIAVIFIFCPLFGGL